MGALRGLAQKLAWLPYRFRRARAMPGDWPYANSGLGPSFIPMGATGEGFGPALNIVALTVLLLPSSLPSNRPCSGTGRRVVGLRGKLHQRRADIGLTKGAQRDCLD
jgi:hypothetical protein